MEMGDNASITISIVAVSCAVAFMFTTCTTQCNNLEKIRVEQDSSIQKKCIENGCSWLARERRGSTTVDYECVCCDSR